MTTINVLENIQMKNFDPLNCSKEDWALYHDFRKKRHMEKNPNDPLSSDDSFEKALQANVQFPEADIHIYIIKDIVKNIQIGEMVCARFMETSPSYEGTKHLVQFDLALLKEYRRKGIGRQVMKTAQEFAVKYGKTVFVANSDEEDGRKFLERIGAIVALAGVENRLELDTIDWKMVEQWNAEGPKKSPNTKMEYYYSIPDEIIEEYTKVYTETMNQQPLGELDVGDIIITPEVYRQQEKMFADMDRTWITAITKEPDGKISGLTEMRYNPSRETFISQILTGVQKEFRGRGLGKWLKANMLLRIKEEFPKVQIITTGNAKSNAPMLSINNRLGFKVHKEAISAQFTLEQLNEFLSS